MKGTQHYFDCCCDHGRRRRRRHPQHCYGFSAYGSTNRN